MINSPQIKRISILVILITIITTELTIKDLCLSENEFHDKYQKDASDLITDLFYEVSSKKIGSGNYGLVKILTLNGKEYAVKKIMLKNDIEFKKSTLDEITYIKLFSNEEGFPKFYECFYDQNEDHAFILQEKLYRDLHFTSKQRNLFLFNRKKKQRLENYLQLFKAVKILHDKNIVHEDIKPENIMTGDEKFKQLYLIDFGLTGKIGEKNRGGTFTTNAPEKNRSIEIFIDPSQDIYSLGITIAILERRNKQFFDEISNVQLLQNYKEDNYLAIRNEALEIVRKYLSNKKKYDEEHIFKKIYQWFMSFFFKDPDWCNAEKKIVCIVKQMIDFVPSKRPTINQVIDYFQEILGNFTADNKNIPSENETSNDLENVKENENAEISSDLSQENSNTEISPDLTDKQESVKIIPNIFKPTEIDINTNGEPLEESTKGLDQGQPQEKNISTDDSVEKENHQQVALNLNNIILDDEEIEDEKRIHKSEEEYSEISKNIKNKIV